MKTYYFHSKPIPNQRRVTIAGVFDSENQQILFGVAECSKKDQFNRKRGRMIAQGRAGKSPIRVVNLNTNIPSEIGKIFVQNAIEIAQLNTIKEDKSLNKYDNKVLFPDKLEKANEMLKKVGLPKQWTTA